MTTPSQPRTGFRQRAARRGALALLAGAIVLLSPTPASAVPADRASALEAWLTVHDDMRVTPGWTGNVASCTVGTESQASLDATLHAINTLRGFAGVQPVSLDPALNRNALAAALMMHAAGRLDHAAGPGWPCYSSEGATGAAGSNLVFEPSGARAMMEFVSDVGIPSLGHRRTLLNPRMATFGTGSTGRANALAVFGAPAPAPSVPDLIAWPPPGHLPWPLIRGTWSAALNVAGTIDASAVQVQVSIDGRAVPVSGVANRGAGNGTGNLISWEVALAESDRDADAAINVTIDGVKVNGALRQFSYAISTIRADTPLAGAVSATRTKNTVAFAWDAAVARGVAVSGYRIYGFAMGSQEVVFDQTVGPATRQVTLTDAAPSKLLGVTVIPLSRAGSPRESYLLLALPKQTPTAGGATTGAGSRARFVGRVTIRLVRPGRLRAGSRLIARADVRGERRLRHQWRRNGRSIAGATRSTYRVRRADRGKRISCRLTAVGTDGVAARRTSSARLVARR